MTRQLPDHLAYHNISYHLSGYSGDRFPSPQFFGIEPESTSTNCYRGYVINLTIMNEQLYLNNMSLWAWSGDIETVPGQIIVPPSSMSRYNCTFLQMDYVSRFSGGMVVGQNFVMARYPRGRATPESFDTILEFTFEEGKLQAVYDHSATIRQVRIDVKKQLQHDLRELLNQPPPRKPPPNSGSLLQRIQTKDSLSQNKPRADAIVEKDTKQSHPLPEPKMKIDQSVFWNVDHWEIGSWNIANKVSKHVKDIWKYDYKPLV